MNDASLSLFQTLRRILNPGSIAVVGASSKANSLGNWFLQSLQNAGFSGAVYPVNPKGGEILGLSVYSDIESLPEPVDLAILAIPVQGVIDSLSRLAGKGPAGVIVTAGGFAETGHEGRKLQDDLAEIANRMGFRIIGPNTMGILCTRSRLNATFSPELCGFMPGVIGIISQSGSVCETAFFRCQERGFGISTMISSGNEADLDLCDFLEYMLVDPDISVISLYVEQIRRPLRFIQTIRRQARPKPIVIFRTGRTAQGTAAASSHTGAMAGADAVMSGLFKQIGLIEARSYDELIDGTIAFAGGRYPKGKRLAVVTGPGAPGVAACDRAVEEGLTMARLDPKTSEKLARILPSIASLRNPVDMTGSAATHPELVAQTLRVGLEDDGVDGVILIFGALSSPSGIDDVIRTAAGQPKPVLAVMVASLSKNKSARTIVEQFGRRQIPSFFSPEQAVRAFRLLSESGRKITN